MIVAKKSKYYLFSNMLSKDYANNLDYFLSNMDAARKDKTTGDGGITVDFWIIKVHPSN